VNLRRAKELKGIKTKTQAFPIRKAPWMNLQSS